MRLDDIAGDRVLDAAGGLDENRLVGPPLGHPDPLATANPGEERRQAIVVPLGEVLEGVMMTPGTADAESEKDLCGIVDVAIQVPDLRIPLRRR